MSTSPAGPRAPRPSPSCASSAQFFTGFGTHLVIGTGMWAVEVVSLFGATALSSAFPGNGEGTDTLIGAGAHMMILINGAVLPLLSTIPIWLIASTELGYTSTASRGRGSPAPPPMAPSGPSSTPCPCATAGSS